MASLCPRWSAAQSPDNEPPGWCSSVQHHTSSYQLVEKGCDRIPQPQMHRLHFPAAAAAVVFVYTSVQKTLPVCPSSPCSLSHANKSQRTAPKCTRQTGQTHTQTLAESVWAPYLSVAPLLIQQCEILREIIRHPEQLTSSPASTPTVWLSDWVREWEAGSLDDWMTDHHSAEGSRAESHSSHQPADWLQERLDDSDLLLLISG